VCTVEPEGYHFGAADGLGLAVWRDNAADAADDVIDDVIDYVTDVDEDKISFGFMTWQSNATLLHCTTQHRPRHSLVVTLVLSVCLSVCLIIPADASYG